MMAIVTGSYLFYLFLPLILLLIGSTGESWTNTLLPHGVTRRWYLELLQDGSFQRSFMVSLKVVATAIGAYGTALALVGTQVNILPLQLYSKISGTGTDFPGAAAMSVILMGMCCLVIGAGELYASRKEGGLRR